MTPFTGIVERIVAEACTRASPAAPSDATPLGLYKRILDAAEKPLLEDILARCHGNQTDAAAILGINRNTLRKLIEQHGIQPAELHRPLEPRGSFGARPEFPA